MVHHPYGGGLPRSARGGTLDMAGKSFAPSSAVLLAVVVCLAPSPFGARADEVPSRDPAALRAEAGAHEHGEGVVRDFLRAFELYCEAARQGDAQAQFDLGWMYANGRGVLGNDPMASLFFTMAAEQGFDQARAMLAHIGPPAAEMPECMRDQTVVEYDDSPLAEFAPAEPEADGEPFVPANPGQEKVAALVRAIAPQYQINPLLAFAFIRAESNFDPLARSPKNAQGLMQLIPQTSARFNVRKPYDAAQNIRGGLAYLRWLLAYFRGNVALVAAAYNAGEGTVERYRGIPPYAETREYVKRIMHVFRKREHPFDPSVTDPSPALERIELVRNRQEN